MSTLDHAQPLEPQRGAKLTPEQVQALPTSEDVLRRAHEALRATRVVRMIERRWACCRQRVLCLEVPNDSALQDGDVYYSDHEVMGLVRYRDGRPESPPSGEGKFTNRGDLGELSYARTVSDADRELINNARDEAKPSHPKLVREGQDGWTTFRRQGQRLMIIAPPPLPPAP